MKILIIKLSSIGDVVHTLPALRALRKLYPDAEIDWLTEPPCISLLESHPEIDNLFVFEKARLRNGFGIESIRDVIGLVLTIRRRQYDIVIDFQGLLKSGVFSFLSGAKRRVGFDKTREFSYIFLNEKLPPYDPDMHAVDRYMLIPKALGAGDEVEFYVPVFEADRKRIDSILDSKGISTVDGFVLINPWARWESKLWDKGMFASLVKEIISRYDFKVIFVGGSDARDYTDGILSSCEGYREDILDLTGRTNLREFAYLSTLARMLITPDSGPMHIASAMGTRVVALFGPTSPRRTGPYGDGHVILHRGLPCAPCFLRRCEDRGCMTGIGVDDVISGIERILGSIAPSK